MRSTSSFSFTVLFLLALASGLACSSSGTSSSSGEDAGVGDGGIAPPDAAPDAPVSTVDCVAQRTPRSAPVCGNDCDVRLYLPAGDSYCTMTCATNADCAPLGAGLVCSAGVGTCVPACANASECTAKGFKTCDGAGACDTQ